MFRRLSHIVLVLLLLSACGRQKGYSPLLLNSDSLCNVRPDSALVLLQQLSLLTRGLSPCAKFNVNKHSMLRQKREENGTGICHVMQGWNQKPVPVIL